MAAIEESEPQSRYRPGVRTGNAAWEDNPGTSDLFWNVATVLVWLAIAIVILAFVSIYNNPKSRLNPFSPFPPTLVSAVSIPTETPTPYRTATVPVTIAPTYTITASPVPPTATFTASPTATNTPTPGPSLTPTIDSLYPFILRNEPVSIAGDAIPDHDTCKLWVAGQTYDLQGAPMVGITVMLGGYLDRKNVYQLSLTGTALQFGQAGYEFIIADRPIRSQGGVWVQLYDQALIPLSARVYIDTHDDCKQNLILVNFRQVR